MVQTKTPETLDRPDMKPDLQFTPEETPKLKDQAAAGQEFCEAKTTLSRGTCENMVGAQGLELCQPSIDNIDKATTEKLTAVELEKQAECEASQEVLDVYLKGDNDTFTQSVAEAASTNTQGFSEVGSNNTTQALG